MSSVEQFIDLVGQGQNVEAQELLNSILSARAFDALEERKQVIAKSIYKEDTEVLNEDEENMKRSAAQNYYDKEHSAAEKRGMSYADAHKHAHKLMQAKHPGFTASSSSGEVYRTPKNEDFSLEDYSLEEIEQFMQSEEYEQLDELSKKTLGSYIKKAGKHATRLEVGFEKASRGSKPDYPFADLEKAGKREAGIAKAVDKLSK